MMEQNERRDAAEHQPERDAAGHQPERDAVQREPELGAAEAEQPVPLPAPRAYEQSAEPDAPDVQQAAVQPQALAGAPSASAGAPQPPAADRKRPSWRLVAGLLVVAGLIGGAVGGAATSVAMRWQQNSPVPVSGLQWASDSVQKPVEPPSGWTADEINTWTVVAHAAPGVVQIQTSGKRPQLTTRDGRPLPPWMQPAPDDGDDMFPLGIGSGFVLDKEGHIVTNHHVVDGADSLQVVFPDGTTVPATLLGSDRLTDLAVIKVDLPPDKLHPLTLADSDEVQVGQKAIAIGSPMVTEGFGLGRSPSVTQGIISAKDRSLAIPSEDNPNVRDYQIDNLIQTDAGLNPGNSGGPLLDSQGRVVGVNTAILPSAQGIGFAVPSNAVRQVAPQLIESGSVQRAALGITYQSLDRLKESLGAAFGQLKLPPAGALVVTVAEDGAAAQAGIRGGETEVTVAGASFRLGGDIIIAVDDVPIHGENLAAEILRHKPGDTVTLTILRDGEEQQVKVTLGKR